MNYVSEECPIFGLTIFFEVRAGTASKMEISLFQLIVAQNHPDGLVVRDPGQIIGVKSRV
jgi:hypothetical protein